MGAPPLGLQGLCLLLYQVPITYLGSEPTQSKSQGQVVRSESNAKEPSDMSPAIPLSPSLTAQGQGPEKDQFCPKRSWLAVGAAILWLSAAACLHGPQALGVLSASLGTSQSRELTAGMWEGLQVPTSS